MKLSGLNISIHREHLGQFLVLKLLAITNLQHLFFFFSLKYVNHFLVISLIVFFLLWKYKLFLSKGHLSPLPLGLAEGPEHSKHPWHLRRRLYLRHLLWIQNSDHCHFFNEVLGQYQELSKEIMGRLRGGNLTSHGYQTGEEKLRKEGLYRLRKGCKFYPQSSSSTPPTSFFHNINIFQKYML